MIGTLERKHQKNRKTKKLANPKLKNSNQRSTFKIKSIGVIVDNFIMIP